METVPDAVRIAMMVDQYTHLTASHGLHWSHCVYYCLKLIVRSKYEEKKSGSTQNKLQQKRFYLHLTYEKLTKIEVVDKCPMCINSKWPPYSLFKPIIVIPYV